MIEQVPDEKVKNSVILPVGWQRGRPTVQAVLSVSRATSMRLVVTTTTFLTTFNLILNNSGGDEVDYNGSNLLLDLLTANISTTKALLCVLSHPKVMVCLRSLGLTEYHYEATRRKMVQLDPTRKSQAR